LHKRIDGSLRRFLGIRLLLLVSVFGSAHPRSDLLPKALVLIDLLLQFTPKIVILGEAILNLFLFCLELFLRLIRLRDCVVDPLIVRHRCIVGRRVGGPRPAWMRPLG
jgi:hypothetical protein